MIRLSVLVAAALSVAFGVSMPSTAQAETIFRGPEDLMATDVSNTRSRDCRVGPFCEWSECDIITKISRRTRQVLQEPKGNGAACPPLVQSKACTPDPEAGPIRASAIPSGGIALLVIDQQVDFHPGGSLAIPNANNDAERIAAFIRSHSNEISQIVFTLDSHQRYHIAHGIFWTNALGESPSPFTSITSEDVANGVWTPRDPILKDYALAYTKALEASNKFKLTIWPEHCIMGTPGHNIVTNVHAAALEWAKQKKADIQYVFKGSNSFTEHYSALRAEYELAYDPATKLNQGLIDNLAKASKVVVVGEALSHCVNYSVRDLVANWPKSRRQDVYVFTDCSSSVPGFEGAGNTFVSDMTNAGLRIMKSTDF
ncbi:hypothetical protein PINS_up022459 [Pythium insidiosum]|nr:hypothetical protein PINS_up012061 [Pythium insidiosum]GLE10358.1 hypothetical protein PINS_up022459 [Pythium insidiosum]